MLFPALRSIATKEVVTVAFESTIQEAIEQMRRSKLRNVIIINHSVYYILTAADLIAQKLIDPDFSKPLSSLRLRQIPVLPADESVLGAINLKDRNLDYVCIVNPDGLLEGIVSYSDIISSIDPDVVLEHLTLSSLFENRDTFAIIGQETPMEEALQMLDTSEYGCLIISDGNGYSGIITLKDILRYFTHTVEHATVKAYMSAPLETLPIDTTIKHAIHFVRQKHFKRVVVEDQGKIVGIVSQKDLVAQSYLHWSTIIKDHYQEIKELSALLKQQNEQLNDLATKDRLTGLGNRRFFEEQFDIACSEAARHGTSLHLLILDIDHFKTVNDTYGHIVGDSALREFSSLIDTHTRRTDHVARWGGEEFILLLHHCDDPGALEIAQALRNTVMHHRFNIVGQITCSIGAHRVNPSETLDENLSKADHALYRAKNGGRNRACFFTQETADGPAVR